MLNNTHGRFFMKSLAESDVNLLSTLGRHTGRYAVAEVYDPSRGAHVALCGPGTRYPEWEHMDVYLMLAIGGWKPGHPAFERTLAIMRYEALLRAGKSGRPHPIRVMHLGSPESVAETAKEELDRREGEREDWESAAA